MVKTVNLNGEETWVTGLGGVNTVVKNLGGSAIFASANPGITEGADNVVEIPAGGGEVVLDTNGTIFLLGSGKIQCTGTHSNVVNFKLPSSSSGGDDSGGIFGNMAVANDIAIVVNDIICGYAEIIEE